MKKLALTIVFAALMTASGMAADMPLKAPVYKAPLPPVYSWTGFYVGGNVGGSWSDSNSVDITNTASGSFAAGQPTAATFAAIYANLSTGSFGTGSNGSFIGGSQIGYNWQSGTFVAGIETDIQGLANQSSGSTTIRIGQTPFAVPTTITSTVSVDKSLSYFGTVRGRLGFLATRALLVYGTGGLAYGGVRTSTSITETNNNPVLGGAFASNNVSDTRVGWTVGGGLEWMFAPNWSAKAEYLYYDLGTVDYGVGTIAPVLQFGAFSPLFVNSMAASTRFNGNIARAGINYHF
jgi:outer membrane immunogenic protein